MAIDFKFEFPLGLVNGAVSVTAALKSLPLNPIAGLEGNFAVFAGLAALFGTVVGLRQRSVRPVLAGVVLVLVVVGGLWYSALVSGGGIPLAWIYVAGLLYAGLFGAAAYLIALLENELIKRARRRIQKSDKSAANP